MLFSASSSMLLDAQRYDRLIFGTLCILFRAPAHTWGHPKKAARPVPHTAKAGRRREYNLKYVVIALIDVIDVE